MALLGGGAASRAERAEGDHTRNFDNPALLAQQQQIMQEQDRSLDVLQKGIRGQKQVAIAIGSELDEQKGAAAPAASVRCRLQRYRRHRLTLPVAAPRRSAGRSQHRRGSHTGPPDA